MAQQVQELIDKIKVEGIQEAKKKAGDIEAQASAQAKATLESAQKQADQIIVDAKEEVKKMQESSQMALRQSARDTLLSLRKEIDEILKKIVNQEVKDTLTPEKLADLITVIVENSQDAKKSAENILISSSAKDVKVLKDSFLAKLQKKIQNEIHLQATEDVGKGLTISFDCGKSSFDYTDDSLAQYLSTYLNSQVAALLQEKS